MDAKQLRHEAERKRAEAEQRRKIAEHKKQDASGHHEMGLDFKADAEEHEVQKLMEEAARFDQEAAQLDAQHEIARAEGLRIIARKQEIKRKLEQELKDLDEQERRLLG